jgi:hypothetical protein
MLFNVVKKSDLKCPSPLRKEKVMENKELIINTAKDILLAHIRKGQGTIDIVGDNFKLLVTKVKEAVDSLETSPEKPLSVIPINLGKDK